MTDIASALALKQSRAQLPVSWYFDQQMLEFEQQLLFENGPSYIGHELMVPNAGDYHTLEWMDHAKFLIRNGNGVELLSNVCRHRQAVMLEGRGNARNIVCPLHRWTYDTRGELLGAPHFPGNPCLNLHKTPLQNWNGLLFAGRRDIAQDLGQLRERADLDFSGYMLDRVHIHECNYNWKTFIEVYLEDYHVVPFHPGLGNFVTCDDLEWQFGPRHSVQTVGIKNRLSRPGAIWLTLYPNIMIEWYPHVLVVSTVHPKGPQATTNVVEFYYPEDVALFEREFVEAEQAAYWETAIEDDEIALRMDRGRKALQQQGISQAGPYQSPMEDGMLHFHEYLRRELGMPA